ncbi:hypothetical protein [Vibrio lentus]|uniref:Uncharacterized protein n=1 Tax=Vibrio lentus TaxID=136468 RepID=A0A4U2EDU9_9VIBR|nr:hypothetical protein [Vibrio lentus]TKG01205.1 hypothetical protein FCV91_23960 [Vibrio lentus]
MSVSLTVEQESYLHKQIELLAGLVFVERKFGWIESIFYSEELDLVGLNYPNVYPINILNLEEIVDHRKYIELKNITYLPPVCEKKAFIVRECLVAFGLYLHLSELPIDNVSVLTKKASDRLAKTVISPYVEIEVDDINTPFRGIISNFVTHLDRLLFDSMAYCLVNKKLADWFVNISSSLAFDMLDEVIEDVSHFRTPSWLREATDVPFADQALLELTTTAEDKYAESYSFRWPSTIAFEADGSLPEVEWPKIGVLKAVGYTVGAQGLPQADRRTILTNVYMQSLPYVDSRSYMNEWGEPLSSDRLKKMAETLASLTKGAKRKTQANMKQAIRDWESDLAWLKEQYYLEHKYQWVWPRAGDKDESDLELTIKEKHYQSSREFLIEQYTNKANELCCQICQSALPFKLESGEYFWEEIPVTKSIDSSPYSDLILCPNHRAMYLHTNSKPNQLLENLGDSFSKKLSIELASEQVSIFVTELHQKKLRLAKELMPRTKASSCLFDFSNIPQGLQGVKKLYLYENQGSWVVGSRAKVIATLTSKSEAKQWLAGFDEHRGVISTITEKVPTPKSKKTKQPKLKTKSSLSVAAVRFGTAKKAEPQSSYKSGYSLCTTCNGDGGINGGCWKCGGSGWM